MWNGLVPGMIQAPSGRRTLGRSWNSNVYPVNVHFEVLLQYVSGHRIRDKIRGIHSWRRGGRSRVSRNPRSGGPTIPGREKTAVTEIVEHGRWWRCSIGGEDMPTNYN